ncbi:MAG: type II toxin-antitoxin system RelE/ParE family toxin [Acidobacteria bacterium]|nr:type II toxin-antitoxin system RelE/ParE family toxin [Acidobacteriota bacterium]
MDSVELADRIEEEFFELFEALGRMPAMGHERRDLTLRAVRFFPLHSFLVVYDPVVRPVRIWAVLRGRRDVQKVLQERL